MLRRRDILAAGALALAGLRSQRATAADEVVVGVLYALSGASAQNGVDARRAS
ncbi:hypothetical protein MKK75_09825 [Methylobacterium sp. J-030]|uniref:hypothetical protein n=1 Tax=Methylobacterium sp. J-030 TaxID=2836627 RepID=UPI001FBB5203|nr:hypothetical protein [Methylobacterium sp. J-030]MCJ2069096.1 hypothetical protein [Methylobacterium sp. J-030]